MNTFCVFSVVSQFSYLFQSLFLKLLNSIINEIDSKCGGDTVSASVDVWGYLPSKFVLKLGPNNPKTILFDNFLILYFFNSE